MSKIATPGRIRLHEQYRSALAAETQAAECHSTLDSHFDSLHQATVAALCRRLAKRHGQAQRLLRDAGVPQGFAGAWLEPQAREFMLRVASPRQLLDVACTMESDLARLYEELAEFSGDEAARGLQAKLLAMARDSERLMREAVELLPAAIDWGQLIAEGAVPALALGAERRLRRGH